MKKLGIYATYIFFALVFGYLAFQCFRAGGILVLVGIVLTALIPGFVVKSAREELSKEDA